MALFQNSVINKYLQNLDRQVINTAYAKFKAAFHNPERQENIRNSKEEQYQEGFLTDLFVNILGYTKNPNSGYNLTTEYKNVKDSKKADGAIIINGAVKAVIELKGTDTTDLSKIEPQAFGYLQNQPECDYVIISNFEKLQFYIERAIDYSEFNLFTLSEEEFKLLYLCLAYNNIKQGLPRKIKEESLSREDAITKKLYNDYSLFKRELYQNLVELNPDHEPLELFKKSQKLLDRFLFLFFAEDRRLLPANFVRIILKGWQQLRDLDEEKPLYDRFKKHFEYLNTGKKCNDYEVFAYNGGLFKPDEILDAVKIDDKILFTHTSKLSEYDFASEVDVNILGHIFENSLNDLDEIKARLAGMEIDKTKTKRKKDGVFYTPKYITKYIVDNTVGKLCLEQKAELQLNEDDYNNDKRKTRQNKIALTDKLTAYRKWLLQLTICDPACGSGAFLNQALDFLIKEHQYIDELHAKLFGDTMILSDVEKSILENNLFGVDLNEESVEIAKLSLWLRTAHPNRKLNDLNNNIKCGNSLIDDPSVAGEKAFNWQKEFPQVFAKGGFDVVIGNPPYAGRSSSLNENEKTYIRNIYKTSEGKFELYQLFIEKCFNLIKGANSFISLITPQTWLSIIQATKLRSLILYNNELNEIVFLGENIFEDASVDSIIFFIKKGMSNEAIKFFESKDILESLSNYKEIKYSNIDKSNFIVPINSNSDVLNIVAKIQADSLYLDVIGDWSDGIKIVGQAKDYAFQKSKINDTFCAMFIGKDINKYSLKWSGLYCCRDKSKIEEYNATDIRLRDDKMFLRQKILIRKTGDEIIATIDENYYYYEQSLFSFGVNSPAFDLKYILSIINSKMINYLLKTNAFSKKETFPQIRLHWLKKLPIKNIHLTDQKPFIEKADLMLSLNKNLQETSQRFQRTLQRKFELADLSNKLQDWYLLPYADFIKELGKKKIKLSLAQEAEWEEYFVQESKKAQELKTTIDATDKAIDRMVYELYGLTEEEIGIVEG